jgi:formylglycine-generating enzyme required for sulfatase activity
MRVKFPNPIKSIIVIAVSIILVTLSIDAADHNGGSSKSIIQKIFGSDEKLCPDDMVYAQSEAGSFCIDKYENSAGNDCTNLIPANQTETLANINETNCKPMSVAGKAPWRNVSQSQAQIECAKAGKKLPSSEMWYYAALGTPDLAEKQGIDDCQVANNWTEHPGPAGSGKNCISSAGAYDMIGNVWEWVTGEINNGNYKDVQLPPQGYISAVTSSGLPISTSAESPDKNYNEDFLWVKQSEVRGIMRGGYWENNETAGIYTMYAVSLPSFSGNGVGFRCAKEIIKN